MNASQPKSHVIVPCGLGCEHASPLCAPYLDWVWCSRPGGGEPAQMDVRLCSHFRPPSKPGADRPASVRERSQDAP